MQMVPHCYLASEVSARSQLIKKLAEQFERHIFSRNRVGSAHQSSR